MLNSYTENRSNPIKIKAEENSSNKGAEVYTDSTLFSEPDIDSEKKSLRNTAKGEVSCSVNPRQIAQIDDISLL